MVWDHGVHGIDGHLAQPPVEVGFKHARELAVDPDAQDLLVKPEDVTQTVVQPEALGVSGDPGARVR